MLSVGVLVSGGGTNLQAIIDSCERGETDAKITCVVSSRKTAYALERAKKHNIPAYAVRKKDFPDTSTYEQTILDIFKKHGVQLAVTAGFMVILSPFFIENFPARIINIHPSLIPDFCGIGYYGLKVHEAVLKSGVRATGATVHFTDVGCDTGPVILQKAVDVLDGDTPETLQKRVMQEAEWQILPQAIQMIAKGDI